jgi:hypothetical protein
MRPFGAEDALRISSGTAEEIEFLGAALSEIRELLPVASS